MLAVKCRLSSDITDNKTHFLPVSSPCGLGGKCTIARQLSRLATWLQFVVVSLLSFHSLFLSLHLCFGRNRGRTVAILVLVFAALFDLAASHTTEKKAEDKGKKCGRGREGEEEAITPICAQTVAAVAAGEEKKKRGGQQFLLPFLHPRVIWPPPSALSYTTMTAATAAMAAAANRCLFAQMCVSAATGRPVRGGARIRVVMSAGEADRRRERGESCLGGGQSGERSRPFTSSFPISRQPRRGRRSSRSRCSGLCLIFSLFFAPHYRLLRRVCSCWGETVLYRQGEACLPRSFFPFYSILSISRTFFCSFQFNESFSRGKVNRHFSLL
jgi:hypothetical protein